jgi:AcrR family transcriptional regulator
MKGSSLLRSRQVAATRDLILDAAIALLRRGRDARFSHEAVAAKAGVGVRTVYRHFPHQSDLFQGTWERLREETQTRFPQKEEEIVQLTRSQFRHFDAHAAIVRASLDALGSDVRARGSIEGRAAFRKSLAAASKGLTLREQRRLVAVCLAIYSAPFWQLLRDRGELTAAEAADAATWAIGKIIEAAKTKGSAKTEQVQPKEGKS